MFARWWSSPSSPFVQVTALFDIEKISQVLYDLFDSINRGSTSYSLIYSSIISHSSTIAIFRTRSNFRIVIGFSIVLSFLLFSPPPPFGEYWRVSSVENSLTKKREQKNNGNFGGIMNNARDGAEETSKIIADDSWWNWRQSIYSSGIATNYINVCTM